MNIEQITFIKNLDPDGCYGTLQSVLFDGNLSRIPFENVAKHLLTAMNGDRKYLIEENQRMMKILMRHNLYTNAVIGKED